MQTSMFQQEFDGAQAFWKSPTRKQQTDREAYLAALRAYHRVAEADFNTALWKVEGGGGLPGSGKDPRRLIPDRLGGRPTGRLSSMTTT